MSEQSRVGVASITAYDAAALARLQLALRESQLPGLLSADSTITKILTESGWGHIAPDPGHGDLPLFSCDEPESLPTGQTFRLVEMGDLLRIPLDRLDHFLADLALGIEAQHFATPEVSAAMPWEAIQWHPVWTDDGCQQVVVHPLATDPNGPLSITPRNDP